MSCLDAELACPLLSWVGAPGQITPAAGILRDDADGAQAVLSEAVLEQLRFKAIGGHQVAWLQGRLEDDPQARCTLAQHLIHTSARLTGAHLQRPGGLELVPGAARPGSEAFVGAHFPQLWCVPLL